MVKNKIFIIFVLLICMVGLTSSARELQDAQENTDALTTGWYWPPFPWWRNPPWSWQQTQPPPLPPPHHHQQPPTPPPHHHHHHHSPPHHHHGPRHPSRHHQPPPPPPSRQNPPPLPPPKHRNPPRPPHHSPSHPPPPPSSMPSAPADHNEQPSKGNVPTDCSKALVTVDGCISDLITSFFRDNVSVGGNCCNTISGISDDCFTKAFTQFKAPDFVGKVRVFCAQNH